MKDKNKPKYNIAQNVGWMVKIAWKNRKRTLLFCVLIAILEVLNNLAQLYIAPRILTLVEDKAALSQLLTTIFFFTAALFLTSGVKEYIDQNSLFANIDVRTKIIGMIGRKSSGGVTRLVAPLCHFFPVGEIKSPTILVRYPADDNPSHFSDTPGYRHGAVDSHTPLAHCRSANPVRLLRTYSGQLRFQLSCS